MGVGKSSSFRGKSMTWSNYCGFWMLWTKESCSRDERESNFLIRVSLDKETTFVFEKLVEFNPNILTNSSIVAVIKNWEDVWVSIDLVWIEWWAIH